MERKVEDIGQGQRLCGRPVYIEGDNGPLGIHVFCELVLQLM